MSEPITGRSLSPEPTPSGEQVSSDEIEPMDWLLNYVAAHDSRVSSHYFHMEDGHHRDCGCPLEGEDDVR